MAADTDLQMLAEEGMADYFTQLEEEWSRAKFGMPTWIR
jgi:hypothetical protein